MKTNTPRPGTPAPKPEHRPLDPDEHHLFFADPIGAPHRSVIVLGPADEVERRLQHPAGNRPLGGLLFPALDKTQWRLVPAEVRVREDGSTGMPFLPGAREAASAAGEPAAETGARAAGEDVLALIQADGNPVDAKGLEWSIELAGRIALRFEALPDDADGEALFAPLVEIRVPRGEGRADGVFSGSLAAGRDSLLVLDAASRTVAAALGTGGALWFVRLMRSRPVLSASDMRARFVGKTNLPPEIQITLPKLPEALSVLRPALVLEMLSREEWTDLEARFRYGAAVIEPGASGRVVVESQADGSSLPIGLRDREAEDGLIAVAEELLADALRWRRGRYARLSGNSDLPLRLELGLVDLVAEYGGALMDAGIEIRLENRPVRLGGVLRLKAHLEGAALEMTAGVDGGGGDFDALDLDAWTEGGLIRSRESYFLLTGKALDQLVFLRGQGMDGRGFLTTSPDNYRLVDAVYSELEADEATAMNLDRKRQAFRQLSGFTGEGELPPPVGFRGTLRSYQQWGYAWLLQMHRLELGGCLADDMGLGKTVQTLAYLCRLRADGRLGASLLVGPVVTLANWIAEIDRFAPPLKAYRYAGPADRRAVPGEDSGTDLVLVSYQTLRNDAEKFLEREWDHVILDEAHYVKNAGSLTFKTVRALRARHRLSLTGTPLENHLGELWAQMSFLNPGLLGSRSHFDRLYARPAEREGDGEALERLGFLTSPFILRRRKKDVLDDLPPKDEIVLRCEMTEDQAEVYNAAAALYYNQVTGLLSERGLDGARIRIFTILNKLRLLAIHPPLAGDQFAGISSGKMALLDSLLEEILEEDHKVLVFSQFLGVLDRTERACDARRWRFARLTGATRDRAAPIAEFSEDPEVKVFLLSLRAGGVGINLTAADYVVLADPWWNPAVEEQAADRAHRIGQTRPVTAYRLITAGTIEEKVLELQERKRGLIAGVLGKGRMPNLGEEDILALLGGGSDANRPSGKH